MNYDPFVILQLILITGWLLFVMLPFFLSFVQVDKYVRYLYDEYKEKWIALNSPTGQFWRPDGYDWLQGRAALVKLVINIVVGSHQTPEEDFYAASLCSKIRFYLLFTIVSMFLSIASIFMMGLLMILSRVI
jgi:hypothetical protein